MAFKSKKKKTKKKKQKLTSTQKKWRKLRRKAHKRKKKIDEGRLQRKRPNVMRTIFPDKAKESNQSRRRTFFWLIGFFLVFLFSSFIVTGLKNLHHDTIMNTTPLGSELRFPLSDVGLKLGDVYTDKNRNLTVVRISYNEHAHSHLPVDGADYDVMLKSKKHKNIKASYGILGSNGDGYLFIKGKMGNQPFQVGMRNKMKITTGTDKNSGDDDSSGVNEVNNKSQMIDTITGKSETSSNKNGFVKWFTDDDEEKPKYDAIDFRINSHSKTTKVYNGSFLNKDGSIKYGEVVKQMNINATVKRYDKKIKQVQDKIDTYDVSIKQFEKRVKKDKHNKSAKRDLKETKESKKHKEEELQELKSVRKQFKDYKFDQSSFEKMSDPDKTIYKKFK